MPQKFIPDPHLWLKHNPRLNYLSPDDLILLKRAAEYYLENDGSLYAWKYVETRMLTRGNLWVVFQAFYWDDCLYQLAEWIPDDL